MRIEFSDLGGPCESIFAVCLFGHNSGKGALAFDPCLRLKLNLSLLHNHLSL